MPNTLYVSGLIDSTFIIKEKNMQLFTNTLLLLIIVIKKSMDINSTVVLSAILFFLFTIGFLGVSAGTQIAKQINDSAQQYIIYTLVIIKYFINKGNNT